MVGLDVPEVLRVPLRVGLRVLVVEEVPYWVPVAHTEGDGDGVATPEPLAVLHWDEVWDCVGPKGVRVGPTEAVSSGEPDGGRGVEERSREAERRAVNDTLPVTHPLALALTVEVGVVEEHKVGLPDPPPEVEAVVEGEGDREREPRPDTEVVVVWEGEAEAHAEADTQAVEDREEVVHTDTDTEGVEVVEVEMEAVAQALSEGEGVGPRVGEAPELRVNPKEGLEDTELVPHPEPLGDGLGEPLSDAVRVSVPLPLPTPLADTDGVLLGDTLRVVIQEPEGKALRDTPGDMDPDTLKVGEGVVWGVVESLAVPLPLPDREGECEEEGVPDTVPENTPDLDRDPVGDRVLVRAPLSEGERDALPLPVLDPKIEGVSNGVVERAGLNEPLAHPDTDGEGEMEGVTDTLLVLNPEYDTDPDGEWVEVYTPLMDRDRVALPDPVSDPDLEGVSEGKLDIEGLTDAVKVANDTVAWEDAVMEGLGVTEREAEEHSVPALLGLGAPETEVDSEEEGHIEEEGEVVPPAPREALGERQGAAVPV